MATFNFSDTAGVDEGLNAFNVQTGNLTRVLLEAGTSNRFINTGTAPDGIMFTIPDPFGDVVSLDPQIKRLLAVSPVDTAFALLAASEETSKLSALKLDLARSLTFKVSVIALRAALENASGRDCKLPQVSREIRCFCARGYEAGAAMEAAELPPHKSKQNDAFGSSFRAGASRINTALTLWNDAEEDEDPRLASTQASMGTSPHFASALEEFFCQIEACAASSTDSEVLENDALSTLTARCYQAGTLSRKRLVRWCRTASDV